MRRSCGWGSMRVDGWAFSTQVVGATALSCPTPGTLGYEIATYATYVGAVGAYGTSSFVVVPPDGSGPITLQTDAAGSCAPPFWTDVTLTKTLGPLRLGVALEADKTLRYALFADAATIMTVVCGGHTITTLYADPPVDAGDGPGLVFQYENVSSAFINFPGGHTTSTYYRFGNLTANATGISITDGPDYAAGYLQPTLHSQAGGGFNSLSMGCPWFYALDVDVADGGGVAVAATVDVPAEGGVTTAVAPHASNRSVRNLSWVTPPWVVTGKMQLQLNTAWCGTQDPAVPSSERPVPLRGNKPKTPSATPATWTPVALSLAASKAVLNSVNSWAQYAGTVAVAGGGGANWTVTAAGSATRRVLLERWRNWTNTIDALFRIDGFKITKHDYDVAAPGQDTWAWGAYAYLDIAITSPSVQTLTLTVEGVNAGFNYTTGAKTGETAYTVTYSVPVASGAQTVRVDLMFPNEGGPYYHERIDAVRFGNLAMGAYTLTSLTLVAVEQSYLKADSAGGMPGAWAAVDGAAPMMLWGENPLNNPATERLKVDECFPDAPMQPGIGGCVPYRDADGAGFLVDRTLAAMVEDVNRIEGWTATYAGATVEADLTDGTNTLAATRLPEWLHPLMPHLRLTPGSTYNPVVSLLATYLRIPPGVGTAGTPVFKLYGRKVLGAVLEALVKTGAGLRAGAGVTMQAVRTDTSAAVASAVTDASGFLTLAVGADSARIYRIEGI